MNGLFPILKSYAPIFAVILIGPSFVWALIRAIAWSLSRRKEN
jgi:hypothetical protein